VKDGDASDDGIGEVHNHVDGTPYGTFTVSSHKGSAIGLSFLHTPGNGLDDVYGWSSREALIIFQC